MAIKYLITGATGGLGKHVLRYFVENVPLSEFAAASSKSSNKSMFEDRGIAFRHINYDDSKSLDTGLHGVENLLFISSVGSARIEQHSRLIDAAKKAGVKHVWYTSLAFGGFGNNSRSPIQAEHVLTEKLLKESGLTYTSIREGIYMEAFSVFLDWHPETTKLILPADGEVAYTLRADLGEGTARIMIRGGYENQIVLFTAEEAIGAKEIVDIINETTARQVKLEVVSREEYLHLSTTQDEGGRPREYFEMIATIWDDIVDGALSTTHPLLHEILGREPTKPRDALRQLLVENRDYVYP
nr:nmrA-like family protein [Colletotrichum truncatum]KAF6791262.1 nmrA-like family protein [Colletotrichum truncatum]